MESAVVPGAPGTDAPPAATSPGVTPLATAPPPGVRPSVRGEPGPFEAATGPAVPAGRLAEAVVPVASGDVVVVGVDVVGLTDTGVATGNVGVVVFTGKLGTVVVVVGGGGSGAGSVVVMGRVGSVVVVGGGGRGGRVGRAVEVGSVMVVTCACALAESGAATTETARNPAAASAAIANPARTFPRTPAPTPRFYPVPSVRQTPGVVPRQKQVIAAAKHA